LASFFLPTFYGFLPAFWTKIMIFSLLFVIFSLLFHAFSLLFFYATRNPQLSVEISLKNLSPFVWRISEGYY